MAGAITCPHCQQEATFETMPEGYATERWGGARPEELYMRCSVCTATFPQRGIEAYLTRQD
jgi:hypothetical protein